MNWVKNIRNILFCIIITIPPTLFISCENKRTFEKVEGENISDGIYDASVTTPSGTYEVQVSVSGGEVEYVDWPNGGEMTLTDAVITNKHAVGTNSRGDEIEIEIE